MKEKSSFTTEKPIDYTQTKDAYEGQRESSSYQDTLPPNKKHPKKSRSSGEQAAYFHYFCACYLWGDNMIDNQDLPIGFTMELAQHSDILNRFAQLPESEQKPIVDGAREIKSRNAMRNYVENMFQ